MSVPMRIRLDPETDQALRKAAKEREMPVATLAAQLVRQGLSADSLPSQHPLVRATEGFLDWEPDREVDQVAMQAAYQYARMAAAGSVPAVKEWHAIMHRLIFEVSS